jgi:hypothetical protein
MAVASVADHYGLVVSASLELDLTETRFALLPGRPPGRRRRSRGWGGVCRAASMRRCLRRNPADFQRADVDPHRSNPILTDIEQVDGMSDPAVSSDHLD